MTRSRVSKKLSSEYGFELSLLQILQVSWLLAKDSRGYDLTEGRYVSAIIDEFGLDDLQEVSETDLNKLVQVSLSGYELKFINDLILQEFEKKGVPAGRVTPLIGLYDLIENIFATTPEESE